MNDKTKRIILITACCLLCGVAVIGIAGRFGGNTVTPSGTVSGSQPDSNDPNVNINNSQGDVNVPSLTPEQSDPGQGANSNGTEQTIQANPVKPDAPEKPESPSGTATLPDDHKAEDVPTSERKTEDEPHPTISGAAHLQACGIPACRGKHELLRSGICAGLRLCRQQR